MMLHSAPLSQGESVGLQPQFFSHGRHRLDSKGDVVIQRDAKIRDAQINVLTVDAARKRFIFQLLLHRGDLHVGHTFVRLHQGHSRDEPDQLVHCQDGLIH